MPVSSLAETIELLRADLTARPPRIAAHRDMPFAIAVYSPAEEFVLRKQLRLLAIGLKQDHGTQVTFISLAQIVWQTVREHGGTDYLFKSEEVRGFTAAQDHVNHLLSSQDFRPAADSLLKKISGLDPENNVVFLVRAGGFAPGIFRASVLLDGLHRRTMVPVIFFYPGAARTGTDLRFYNIPSEANLGVYNYRVRIYGAES
jgi:hypothetical protein